MPSNIILEQKKAVVADLVEKLRNAKSGVLVQYQGITVSDDTALRKTLREAGVEYSVMKNTLTGRACEEVGLGEMKQYLEGMTAIATCKDDEVAPAKVMKEYADKIESFEIKAGFVDGKVIDKTAVEALASIPSREVLVGKMLGSMTSCLYSFCRVLQAIVDKAGEESGEAAEAPAEA